MPIVMETMDTSVVSAMMLAANLPSPPAATAIAKLAAAVGLEKNIQRMIRGRKYNIDITRNGKEYSVKVNGREVPSKFVAY